MGVAYELRIELQECDPAVWRRINVPGEAPLYQLDEIIRMTMGWDQTLPSDFVIRGKRISSERP